MDVDVIEGASALMRTHVRPLLRGHLHGIAATLSVPGLVWLVKSATSVTAAVAAWVYGLTAIVCYLTSFTYHVVARSDRARELMRRADHSGIYLLIAGTGTPITLLAMHGWERWALTAVLWVGATIGIVFCVVPRAKLGAMLYMVLGWAGVAALPSLANNPSRVTLAVAAGVLYTIGAILLGLRRPRLRPNVFGYHEFWHGLGVAAGALLFAVNLSLIASGG